METLETSTPKSQDKFLEKKKALAAIISQELRRRNISQSTFARQMCRHRPEISRWLSGRHNFTLDTLFEIESKLNINFFRTDVSSEPVRGQGLTISLKARYIPQFKKEAKTIVSEKVAALQHAESSY